MPKATKSEIDCVIETAADRGISISRERAKKAVKEIKENGECYDRDEANAGADFYYDCREYFGG